MTTTTQLMTAEEFFLMADDHVRRQLIKGEVRAMAPSGGEHGTVAAGIIVLLGTHVRALGLGRMFAADAGFLIASNPDTVLAPDAAFIRKGRLPAACVPKKFVPMPPDLAIEVVSPGDTVAEVQNKTAEWLAAGTEMVWVVRPEERTVSVHRRTAEPLMLTENDLLDGQDVVPGFRCKVREIFD